MNQQTVDGITVTFLSPEDDTTEFLAWMEAPRHAVGFDVETGGPDPLNPFVPGFEVRLISFASEKSAWVLDGRMTGPIRVALASAQVFVAHNAGFDTLAVRSFYGLVPRDVIDTYLLALMVFPPASDDEGLGEDEDEDDEETSTADDRHRLKRLSVASGSTALRDADKALQTWFAELEPRPRGGEASDAVRAWEGRCYATARVDQPVYWVYNGLDGVFCLRVLRWLLTKWEGDPADIRALLVNECRLGGVLTGVQWRGLRVDRHALGGLFRAAVDSQVEMLPAFAELGVENPASATQVAAALATHGVVDPVLTDTGNVSTDKRKGLPRLREPDQPDAVRRIGTLLAEYRDHGKLRTKTREIGGLVQAIGDGRTHPQLNALKARTGRMSISRPALQNLPKKDQRIRAAFLAEDGHILVGADFSQVEYRVAAALSGDKNMIEVIKGGRDLHDHTATAIFGPDYTEEERQTAKTVGFSVLYGAGATRVAGTIGETAEYAQKIIDGFFAAYPSLKTFIDKTKRDPLIVSMSGRRTPVHPEKAFASTNYHIQGTARDVFADALLRLRAAGWGDSLWLVIHDEIILQVREDQAQAARAALEAAMTTTFMGVPITAEAEMLGTRWGHLPEPTAHEETA